MNQTHVTEQIEQIHIALTNYVNGVGRVVVFSMPDRFIVLIDHESDGTMGMPISRNVIVAGDDRLLQHACLSGLRSYLNNTFGAHEEAYRATFGTGLFSLALVRTVKIVAEVVREVRTSPGRFAPTDAGGPIDLYADGSTFADRFGRNEVDLTAFAPAPSPVSVAGATVQDVAAFFKSLEGAEGTFSVRDTSIWLDRGTLAELCLRLEPRIGSSEPLAAQIVREALAAKMASFGDAGVEFAATNQAVVEAARQRLIGVAESVIAQFQPKRSQGRDR